MSDPRDSTLRVGALSTAEFGERLGGAGIVVRIGPFDYNIYANSQLNDVGEINRLPLRTVAGARPRSVAISA